MPTAASVAGETPPSRQAASSAATTAASIVSPSAAGVARQSSPTGAPSAVTT